jgi:uncharacterized membrane protein
MAKARQPTRRKSRAREKTPGEHAKEALAQWRKAAKHGAAAMRARNNGGSAKSKAEKGGRAGSAADALLSKLGAPGKAASKLGMGSRLVERLTPDVELPSLGLNGNGDHPPLPIQVAIEVAVPVRAAWDLATSVDDYPEFLDRVENVGASGDRTVSLDLHYRGRTHQVELEVVDERREQRIDWRTVEGPECSGIVSFHELAPRLTHIELTLELEPDGVVDKVTRATHLTERAIRSELQRFKAHAELDLDAEDFDEEPEPEPEEADEPEAREDDEYEDEYDDDLEEEEDEPEGEAYVEETTHDDEHHEAYEEVGR